MIEPVAWVNYKGDVRAAFTAGAAGNANPYAMVAIETPFGTFFEPVDERRGPDTVWQWLWPVDVEYHEVTDTTRVGLSYVQPGMAVET